MQHMPRQKFRRLAAAALLLFIAAYLLPVPVGAEDVIYDEPLNISVSSANSTLVLQEDDALLNAICSRFNVEFSVISADAYNYSEFYRLLAALNSLPDIIQYDARWDLNYFIQCGALSPLPLNLYTYPDLRSYITYPYARALQYDGLLWGIPSSSYVDDGGAIDTCAVFHKDIYDSAWPYSEPPSTMDEWYDLLSNIALLNDNIIPLTSRNPQAMFELTYFYSPATYGWVWSGDRYIPGYYSDEFYNSICALKTCWDAGLLDPDFMEEGSGRPSGLDKFMLGQAGGIMYNCSPHVWHAEFVPSWQKLYPDTPLEESIQLVFLPSAADGTYKEAFDYNLQAIYFGSSVQGEKMTRILDLLDWLCSSEGRLLRRYGMEGDDYQIGEDGSVIPSSSVTELYSSYPSYSFFRTLPDQDSSALWASDLQNSDISFVINQYNLWREESGILELANTSLNANTVTTPSVLSFNPNILHNSFRMLTSNDAAAEFEKIKQEYIDNGILLMIDSVHFAL